jgi:hypothetical protein
LANEENGEQIESKLVAPCRPFLRQTSTRGGIALNGQRDRKVELRPDLLDKGAAGPRQLDRLEHPHWGLSFEQLQLGERERGAQTLGRQPASQGCLFLTPPRLRRLCSAADEVQRPGL